MPTYAKSKVHRATANGWRTQPCDAGYVGTTPNSWNAIPPSNGSAHGSHSRNGVDHQRGILAYTLKWPGGVGVEGFPEDTAIAVTTRLFSIRSASWRSSRISARRRVAGRLLGVGRAAFGRRVFVGVSTTPVRSSRSHFWKARIAS